MTKVKKWKLKDQYPPEFAKNFPHEDDISRQLLFNIGIKDATEMKKFFSPDYDADLHNPFLLKNMDKAVERIIKAIKNKEKILVFGDYDADGMGGATIFTDFFKAIDFNNFEVYIPDRYKDGYGLSLSSINEFISSRPNLVITIDCGVTNVEEVDRLNAENIDVIIIDHHLVPAEPPKAYAILDPKQEGDEYPFKDLCGAGMGFKTIQAILEKEYFNLHEGWEKWLLDVVCISTIADMVPLVGENRALVFYGLKVLKKTKRPGLKILFTKLRLNKNTITAEDVAFSIGPHINAASRMGHETTSYELLTTNSEEEAKWLADKIHSNKQEQRTFVDKVINDAKSFLDKKGELPDIIVIGNKNWKPGVLGIAANRVMDMYERPVFLWGMGDESPEVRGSARSRGDISVVEVMRNTPKDFFIDSGGHHKAGGFSIDVIKIDRLEDVIREAAQKTPKQQVESEELQADAELNIEDVNYGFYGRIERFEPFGMANPAPVFWLKAIEVKHANILGNSGIHTKWLFHKASGEDMEAVGFWLGESPDFVNVKPGDKVDVLANVEVSNFNGKRNLRLRILNFKINS